MMTHPFKLELNLIPCCKSNHFPSRQCPSFCIAAVQSSMPQFYEKMKTRLRTVEEGADTIIWLAVADAALKQESGLFFQGMLA